MLSFRIGDVLFRPFTEQASTVRFDTGCAMSGIRKPLAVKPICGLTYQETCDLERVLENVEADMGSIEDRSDAFPFSFTTYYEKEMGGHLYKCFLSFTRCIHPARLPELKIKSNSIERSWTTRGKRRINLDPGYITGAKLVLASTKDFAHRLFLSDGIYGDVQLQYAANRFNVQPWTYPDYRTDIAFEFFHRVRQKYLTEVRQDDRTAEL